MAIIFRTTDNTKWGAGQGTDLDADQIDNNFWELLTAIQAVEAAGVTIDHFAVSGDQFFVHMTDHQVLGPYQLPTAQWNFRDAWLPSTAYAVMDVVTANGGVFLVIFAHTSAGTFDPGANDGLGHDYYAELLGAPDISNQRSIAIFAGGQVNPSELLFSYVVTEPMTLRSGLPDTQAATGTPTTVGTVFEIQKNGSSIGTINFLVSPAGSFDVTFGTDIDLDAGDVVSIIAPASPDPHQTDISITLVATLPT